jgi:XRE family transcriptional regulator, fatty acid utilization regulator
MLAGFCNHFCSQYSQYASVRKLLKKRISAAKFTSFCKICEFSLMKKAFMGVRLRRLREERGLTQVALARALELSPSYLNQLERNQRPLTVGILLKINSVFGIDVQLFAENEEAKLLSDLRDTFADAAAGEKVGMTEMRELVANMPAVGRALVTMHRRYRDAMDQCVSLAARLGDEWRDYDAAHSPAPFEEVRDFFYARHNHIAELDEAAERIFAESHLRIGDLVTDLTRRLQDRHGIRVVVEADDDIAADTYRRYDSQARLLHVSSYLRPGQQAFQIATQIAFLELDDVLCDLTDGAAFASEESRALARIGLANYFAGALLLPYEEFLRSAEALHYDIERLSRHFGVGFETVCHRLSTLQRPDARGVPFFFVRVDRAGNVSKRQSATDFHFSRLGGTCPLWNVYEAFAMPNTILTQVARMPDGRTYFWIARTVSRSPGGYGAPSKTFAIGLGCDIRHAHRLIYSKGFDLTDTAAATPIGVGCKVCERSNCPQRAFPPIGRKLTVDEARRWFAPYPVA